MPKEHDKVRLSLEDDLGGYLTAEEREHLLADLHRVLVWVGVKIPEEYPLDGDMLKGEMHRDGVMEGDLPPEVHLNEGYVDLHDLVWRLIHEDDIGEREEREVEELIRVLETEERLDEDRLKETSLTHQEARRLYDETAGLIRALMDLKDLLKKKGPSDAREEAIRRKVEDARRWKAFVDEVKDKKTL